jgi:hypothetical protein
VALCVLQRPPFVQSWQFNDISTSNDATAVDPAAHDGAGTVILLIALVDDFVLEWKGARLPRPEEALHNE